MVYTPNHAPKIDGCVETLLDSKKQKTRISTGREAGFWTSLDFVRLVPGGETGIRTPDRL